MFCLRERGEGDAKLDDQSEPEDDFGWWLNDRRGNVESFSGRRECRSSGSSMSMQSCIDSDDPETYSFVEDSARRETNGEREKAELRSSTPDKKLDVNLIERDAREADTKQRGTFTLTIMRTDCNGCSTDGKEFDGSRRSESMSYTPERLVKSQEYRILTPEPRYMCVSITRTPDIESSQKQETLRCGRRLDYLNNSSEPVALKTMDTEIPKLCLRVENPTDKDEKTERGPARQKNKDCHDRIKESQKDVLPTIEESNYTWSTIGQIDFTDSTKGQEETITRRLTLENTSGPRRKGWSPFARSCVQRNSNHLCLCDELSLAIENGRNHHTILHDDRPNSFSNDEIDPIDLTSEEDRFCQVSSAHDPLTRLALAIETDGSVSDFTTDPDIVVHQLRSKVDKLRISRENIYKDLSLLRAEFQEDEERVEDLSSEAMRLRQDIHEVRYLDDLLKLLEGEVDRISQRNWPFLIGRSEAQSEELNLVI